MSYRVVLKRTWRFLITARFLCSNRKDIEAQKFLDDSILEKIYKQKQLQKAEAKAKREAEPPGGAAGEEKE